MTESVEAGRKGFSTHPLTGGTTYTATDPDVAAATPSLTNTANGYWTILKATKPFSGGTPFSDIPPGTASDNLTDVYSRLHAMSLAYWVKGGALYQTAALLADIITPLDWLNANVYDASTTQYGNWFTWLIGTPLRRAAARRGDGSFQVRLERGLGPLPRLRAGQHPAPARPPEPARPPAHQAGRDGGAVARRGQRDGRRDPPAQPGRPTDVDDDAEHSPRSRGRRNPADVLG